MRKILPDAAAKSTTARGALGRRGRTGMTANVDRRAYRAPAGQAEIIFL
jgi:hypothetical protein